MEIKPEYLALGFYLIDRILELHENQGLSEDAIRERLPGEIETFVKNREQMDKEIAEANG